MRLGVTRVSMRIIYLLYYAYWRRTKYMLWEALEISEEEWQASKCYEFTIAILNKARCSCPEREMITASCNQIKGSYFRQSWNTNRKTWTVAQTQDPGYTLCKYNWLVEIKCIHVQLMHVYRNRVFFFPETLVSFLFIHWSYNFFSCRALSIFWWVSFRLRFLSNTFPGVRITQRKSAVATVWA